MQMRLVRVSIQISLFTKPHLTMQTPLVRVTLLNQFFHQNCLNKHPIYHGNTTRASNFLN